MRPLSERATRRADARSDCRARVDREPRRSRAATGPSALIGAIVAGGGSTRFGGEPKGLREVGGVRIIDRVARALRAVTADIIVIANAPDAPSWLPDVRVIADVRPERASVVGLHTALRAASGGAVIAAAWDMPFVSAELLAMLRDRLRPHVDAVVPDGPRGPEAFCAVYAPSALAPLERSLERGVLRLADVLRELRVDHVTAADLAPFGAAERLFFNVNEPGDLAAAERMARGG